MNCLIYWLQVCVFCQNYTHMDCLGDLYGPYFISQVSFCISLLITAHLLIFFVHHRFHQKVYGSPKRTQIPWKRVITILLRTISLLPKRAKSHPRRPASALLSRRNLMLTPLAWASKPNMKHLHQRRERKFGFMKAALFGLLASAWYLPGWLA